MQREYVNKRIQDAGRSFQACEGWTRVEGLGGSWAATDMSVDFESGTIELRLSPVGEAAPWSGEGLPPVGCECETSWDSGKRKYVTCRILAHDEDRAVFRFTSGPSKGEYSSATAEPCEPARDVPQFRPLLAAWGVEGLPPAPTKAECIEAFGLSPEALTAAVWNGEGLPPVGCECEFMWDYRREGSDYVRVRILAHDGGGAVLRVVEGGKRGVLRENLGGDCGSQPIFRPLRTAEQLAAEAREKAIEQMRAALKPDEAYSIPELLGALYDAGARLPGKGLEE